MKKSEFKTLIREIVREEVKIELRSFLKEYKQNRVKKEQVITNKQTYSKNSVINDILNETAQSDDWKTLGDRTFSTKDMGSILSKEYAARSPESTISSTELNNSQVPSHITDALTKDYRGLMQAIDKKKGPL